MLKCDIVLVAGGSGSRYNSEVPKQFDSIHGQPLYLWSLNTFLNWPISDSVIVVAPKDWVEPIRLSFKNLPTQDRVIVVEGGASRQESATRGVSVLSGISQNEWVMVHDAARPALTESLIERVWQGRLTEAEKIGGVIPGLPVKETIKEVDVNSSHEVVTGTLQRAALRVIQTPQLLLREPLLKAYEEFKGLSSVDDASLLEKSGYKIIVVDGEYDNVKVTFAEDRARVSDWLRNRHPSL